jgi:F-type H+-transporting ATPase subunit delta
LKSASLQYANALADVVLAQGAAEPAAAQLREFSSAYSESPELQNFLGSPAVSAEDRRGVIAKIATRLGTSKIIRNFLFVIVDHRRARNLPEIADAFQEVVRQRQGIAEAQVYAAVRLTEAQKAELTQSLTRMTGKIVDPNYFIDPELLGGALVRVGDTIYDGSLRNRLEQLRARLAAE